MNDLGTFTRHADLIDAAFVRHYPQPIEKVWAALTDPAGLAGWMGVSEVEPRVGGRIRMMIGTPGVMEGEIRVFDRPHVLEFTWSNHDCPQGLIRYTLTSESGGTRLVFGHRGMPFASSALMLPGWHVLFAALGMALEGAERPATWQDWPLMQTKYIEAYGLEGAAVSH